MTEKTQVCPECDSTDIKDGVCQGCFHQFEAVTKGTGKGEKKKA